jgi:C1A family cysteine protease
MVSFNEVNARLSETQARWTARQTPQSLLSDREKRALLGVVIDRASLGVAMAPSRLAAAPVANFAPAIDWRNRNGNHVTKVKDQGGCGSCVSFCTTAVVESMASIEMGQLLDLSEADLHFCSSHGASCGGWWPDQAYDQIKVRGVINETDFSYMSAFDSPPKIDPNTNLWIPHCVNTSNRSSAVKITNSSTLANVVDRKNYLTNTGPCSAVLHVFEDFYSYGSGVYQHVTGADVGLHCVEIIGYSEAEQCWIIKNSWGTGWGENGFGKIAYGEIGIDTEFPFWTASGVIMPVIPQGPERFNAIWAKNNEDRTAVWGWARKDFDWQAGNLQSQGYRLMDLNAFVLPNGQGERFNAIWAKNNEDRTAVWGWARKDFDAQAAKLQSQGYRLMKLNAFVLPNGQGERFNAIWAKNNEDRTAVWGWARKDFDAQAAKLQSQGYRLMDLNAFVLPNGQGERFNAIWAKNNEDRTAVWGWARKDFDWKASNLKSQGYRLIDLNAFVLPNGQGERFNAIWAKNNEDRTAVWGWARKDFDWKASNLKSQGYHLMDLNAFVFS